MNILRGRRSGNGLAFPPAIPVCFTCRIRLSKLRPPILLAIYHPPQEIFIDSMSSPMFNLLKSLMRLLGFNTSSVP